MKTMSKKVLGVVALGTALGYVYDKHTVNLPEVHVVRLGVLGDNTPQCRDAMTTFNRNLESLDQLKSTVRAEEFRTMIRLKDPRKDERLDSIGSDLDSNLEDTLQAGITTAKTCETEGIVVKGIIKRGFIDKDGKGNFYYF
jgi:hypothetical protein